MNDKNRLPLVVCLGFGGSRHLIGPSAGTTSDEITFLDEVQSWLATRLKRLPLDLNLGREHFLCGVSQVAIGADTLFTRACQELAIPQRILLPESKDYYLSAVGSDGTPDFTISDRAVAKELMASPHVIQERVVSDAGDRTARFEDVNLEIVRVCDVLICLLRAEASGKPGGTHDLIDRATRLNKPTLVISVGVKDGKPDLHETWHWNDPPSQRRHLVNPSFNQFLPPALPPALADLQLSEGPGQLPAASDYSGALKAFASEKARRRKNFFKGSALAITGTHVLATFFALIALKVHGQIALPWLLSGELVLLTAGFAIHQFLHHSGASQVWAMSRLVAELARSVLAIGELHIYFDYLYGLPFPRSLQPLLRTIETLHLRSTRRCSQPWVSIRDAYITKRLTGVDGQLEFYRHESATSGHYLKMARAAFIVFSLAAMVATATKLLYTNGWLLGGHAKVAEICGVLAVLFPVLAVAALSLAASFDVEGRHHTFRDMSDYLEVQTRQLNDSRSEREFAKLLLETESRLLGETVNWYFRRSFTPG